MKQENIKLYVNSAFPQSLYDIKQEKLIFIDKIACNKLTCKAGRLLHFTQNTNNIIFFNTIKFI